jgi:hypothetical protein
LGALASMIAPLEVPLLDPEVEPLDVAPEPPPDPLDPELPPLPEPDADPELPPLPEPDAPELPLVPARFPLLPPLVPLLPAAPEELASSDAAPCPDELEPLPHPTPTAQAKAASESDATMVDRCMEILLNSSEAQSARERLRCLFADCCQRASFYHAMFAPGRSPEGESALVSGSHLRLRMQLRVGSATAEARSSATVGSSEMAGPACLFALRPHPCQSSCVLLWRSG